MIRRMLRKTVQNLKEWVVDDPNVRPKNHPQSQRYAFPWLNSLLYKAMKEGNSLLRPNYTWGMLNGAYLASTIGIERVSVIEFGVAGGNGLIAMDRAVDLIERELGVHIDVYGFDTGKGLPKPTDYRDLPNLYRQGTFAMDTDKLKARLSRAKLILGDVKETVPEFIASEPAPVAYVSNDLDLYSSTASSFKLLEAHTSILMPRIYCHFDDVLGLTFADHNGERLAISEFNANHSTRKISPIYGLKHFVPRRYSKADWIDETFLIHILDHPAYNAYDGLVKPHHLTLPS